MSDKQIELAYWLTSDDPNAAHRRKTAPTDEWAAALREYKGLNMENHNMIELNRITYELVMALSGDQQKPDQDIAELSKGDLKRYIATRSTEADRLIASLDNPLMGPDQRQETIERLTEITDELRRGHQLEKKLERQGVS